MGEHEGEGKRLLLLGPCVSATPVGDARPPPNPPPRENPSRALATGFASPNPLQCVWIMKNSDTRGRYDSRLEAQSPNAGLGCESLTVKISSSGEGRCGRWIGEPGEGWVGGGRRKGARARSDVLHGGGGGMTL